MPTIRLPETLDCLKIQATVQELRAKHKQEERDAFPSKPSPLELTYVCPRSQRNSQEVRLLESLGVKIITEEFVPVVSREAPRW